ncbi:MAG TPA: S8 family serine peptidase [Azospirillaceae bacterium]|nr:S8 family serine peptidase [Azospirillaceae bacterium]
MPTTPTDSGYAGQWYLQPATGLDFTLLWDEYRGRGVTIGVVDTGFDHDHPDFAGRIDRAIDYDAVDRDDNASATGDDVHGFTVARILAAGINDGGTVGAAPGATLAGFRMGAVNQRTAEQEVALLQRQGAVDISHNSWSYSGRPFFDDFAKPAFAPAAQAVRDAAATGRDGLGTVFVRSAGNYRAQGDDLGAHNYGNDRHAITVGAVDRNGIVQSFSNPGAALMLAAPGDATSWAAPLVSGTVALMLEANPALGWRDVQDILAYTARQTDPGRAGWLVNGAQGWNGGGLTFSRDYGHGIVDPRAAVRLAESWTIPASTSANERSLTGSSQTQLSIPDGGASGITSGIAVTGGLRLDRAVVTLDIEHARAGDLQLFLTSPAGTRVALYDRIGNGATTGPLRFSTSVEAFRDEAGAGTWTLGVVDAAAGNAGTLRGWSIALYGDTPTDDTVHVFTDAFGTLSGTSRATLRDAGGRDVLNAAAVGQGMVLDLRAGASSTIAGRTLTIEAGAQIEDAVGGDGADRITGTALANRLRGGRGDDTLQGGAGDDTLEGGAGSDEARFAGTRAEYRFTELSGGVVEATGPDGTDRLTGIEFVRFGDGPAVAVGTLFGMPSIGTGRTEAEALGLSGGYRAEAVRFASGGQLIMVPTGATGTATGTFTGAAGSYVMTVAYHDESDGRALLGVRINGAPVQSWAFDADPAVTGGGGAVAANLMTRSFAVTLAPGDTIALEGQFRPSEHARLDWIELSPSNPPPPGARLALGRTEAEALDLSGGYAREAKSFASGGQLIMLQTGTNGSASGRFDGPAGRYNLAVAYHDESDGASLLGVSVNGASVSTWTLNANPAVSGGAGAVAANRVVRTVTVDLAPGDIVALNGQFRTGEHSRVDWIELSAAPPPSSTPPPAGVGRTEAEAMALSGYAAESVSFASGGRLARLTATEGTARASFTGPDGDYVLRVAYHDESDGAPVLGLSAGGVGLASWTSNASPGGSGPTTGNRIVREVAATLRTGDVLEVSALRGGDDLARLDWIEVVAAPSMTAAAAPASQGDGLQLLGIGDGGWGWVA